MAQTVHIGSNLDDAFSFKIAATTLARMQSGKPMCYMYNIVDNTLDPVFTKEQVQKYQAALAYDSDEPIAVALYSYWWDCPGPTVSDPVHLAVHEFSNDEERFHIYFIGSDDEELLEYTKWFTINGTPERVYDLIMSPSPNIPNHQAGRMAY